MRLLRGGEFQTGVDTYSCDLVSVRRSVASTSLCCYNTGKEECL